MGMEIHNKDDGKRGSFFIDDGNTRVGELNYIFAGPAKMIIVHTEVNEDYEGKGLGMQLVKASVGYARENHIKILPLCPFAKKIFDVTPGFADVLF
ncbi:MAG: GNAT family N-acetyltransferase [Mucilaginibacter sp.]